MTGPVLFSSPASIPVPNIESAFPGLGSLQAVDVTQRNGLGDGGGRVVSATLRDSSGSVTRTGPQPRGNDTTTPGVFRAGRFFLRNANSSGVADDSFSYGDPVDVPVCGDWNGDGKDTVGVVRGAG
ncbi:MAG: hypothetical protein M3507_07890 [Actinomycetota bacterium]|nr:hypothetical protein [Actinomycetota bacterium]